MSEDGKALSNCSEPENLLHIGERDWSVEQLAEVTLHQVDGIGPRLRNRLLERFGSIHTATQASTRELRSVPGFGQLLIDRFRGILRVFDPTAHVAHCAANGIRIVLNDDPDYPPLLRHVEDRPSVLYCRGSFLREDSLAIAIVGTRRATPYGRRQAERFADALARCGFTIVSGLARGIDGAAHRSALAAEGRTIAVLGSGIESIYPPEHQSLAQEIAQQGLVMSELHPSSRPRSGSFPRRNRLISGLSLAVLVVEAAPRSGALITARHALEQNREVFAIPGRIDQLSSRGCHALIRDGAKLVESVEDIVEELGPLEEPVIVGPQQDKIQQPQELMLSEQENAVLQALSVEALTIDDLVLACHLPVQRVLATLSVLEMKRLVVRLDGNRISRRFHR